MRARGNDGNAIGRKHSNPLMDTRIYDCELGDGTVYRYSENVIVENIFSQCDNEERCQAVLHEIVDHRSNRSAVHISNGYITTKQGRQIPKARQKGGSYWYNGKMDLPIGSHSNT
jgi:hypothetical protein